MAAAIALRDYQETAFTEIRVEFKEKNDPVLFVLSTGAGKTFTFSAIAQAASSLGNHVTIVVHRKELLLQASKSLSDLGIEHGLISPYFTPNKHARVQVASIDTLLIRLKKTPYKTNLLIVDEAHHCISGNKWGRLYGLLGKPRMLGVTATPVRADGKGLGEKAGGLFKSMVLGPPISELIRRGMLVEPEVYTSLDAPEADVAPNKDGSDNLIQLAAIVDKPRITGDAVDHYTQICPGARAVVFCCNITHAKHVVNAFNAAGYKFRLLVGAPEMADRERDEVNKLLKAGAIDGVCTVDLISEGYDVPGLEVCIMLRHTASEGLFLQQVGRVMRPFDGKRGCWLLDHVGNVGRMTEKGFKLKHGFPNTDRDWTLEGRKKKPRGVKPADEVTINMKQCTKCYYVHMPAPCCPKCGFEYPEPTRALEQVEGQLEKVTADIAAQAIAARQAQASAKTVDELMAQMGYTRGRAEAIVKARAEKSAMRQALQDDMLAWRQESGQVPMHTFGIAISDLRRLKPKELKALRERFDAHVAAHRAGNDTPFGEFLHQTLNPAGQQPAF